MKILVRVILFNLLFSSLIFSQVQNPQWRNYTNCGTVSSIADDGDYIWLGTYGGLVRMNKTTQQKIFFNKGNSYLPSNHINSIAIDSSGYLWLATGNGLVKFKDNTWAVFKTGNSGLPQNLLTCIVIDDAGNKWIGTRDSGLVMYDDVNWTVYDQQNSSLSNNIRALKFENEILWIGTYTGLYRMENNDFSYITVVGNRQVNCLEKDIQDNTWIGTSSGLLRLTGIDSIAAFSSHVINCLGIDNHNVKWFGTGVYYGYSGKMYNIDSADTQVTLNNLVNSATDYPWFHSMLLESSGTGWFGSEDGLVKSNTNAEFLSVSNSTLGRIYVTKMFIDHNNTKWFYAWGPIPLSSSVLPPGYLASITDSTWTVYNLTNSPVDIGGVAAVSDFWGNDMFVAVYSIMGNTELYHYSSGNWELVDEPMTQYDLILYMWFDEVTGNLWVDYEGANGENNLFITTDGYSWTPVPDYPVYDINQMKRLGDIIWIASPQGLIKYDGANFTLYTTANSGLPSNIVSSLDIDSQGNVWAGTQLGVVKYDGTNWTVYDRNNSPLTCDDISGLAIDPDDNIYLGNSLSWAPALGLIKFDGTNWTFFNNNNSGKPDYAYGYEDINSLAIDAVGNVWFATNGGVGVYDEDGVPIPVELISFNAIPFDNEIQLTWSTSTETNNYGFEIERAASNSENPKWREIAFIKGSGTTTFMKSYSYTDKNISPGIYLYRLKQIDFNGTFKYSKEIKVEVSVPLEFSLSQNYPNPFNPTTTFKYCIPKDGYVSLKVYNVLGQQVAELIKGVVKVGSHQVVFSATKLSSGVYYYRIEAGENISVRKMVVLK